MEEYFIKRQVESKTYDRVDEPRVHLRVSSHPQEGELWQVLGVHSDPTQGLEVVVEQDRLAEGWLTK